jgi:DNA-binding winged helix-turn-helix (wHTH) protein
MKKAFNERGETRHEIRTVEELGFVFDERVEIEREAEEEKRRTHPGSS